MIPPIVVLYSCITNYPKTQRLKTTNIYYCIVSLGQDSGSSLAGWPLAQSFSGGCSLDVHQGSNHLNSQLGLEDLLLAHSRLLAKIQLPRFLLASCTSSQDMQAYIPRTDDPKERMTKMEATVPFDDLSSKVTHDHFCLILFVRSKLLSHAHTQGREN